MVKFKKRTLVEDKFQNMDAEAGFSFDEFGRLKNVRRPLKEAMALVESPSDVEKLNSFLGMDEELTEGESEDSEKLFNSMVDLINKGWVYEQIMDKYGWDYDEAYLNKIYNKAFNSIFPGAIKTYESLKEGFYDDYIFKPQKFIGMSKEEVLDVLSKIDPSGVNYEVTQGDHGEEIEVYDYEDSFSLVFEDGKVKGYYSLEYPEDGIMYESCKDEELTESENQNQVTESFKEWADAYSIFRACTDRFYPDEDKIIEAAKQVYEIFKGDPNVDKAWEQWNYLEPLDDYEERHPGAKAESLKEGENCDESCKDEALTEDADYEKFFSGTVDIAPRNATRNLFLVGKEISEIGSRLKQCAGAMSEYGNKPEDGRQEYLDDLVNSLNDAMAKLPDAIKNALSKKPTK